MANFVRALMPAGIALAATFLAAPALADFPYVVAEQPMASDFDISGTRVSVSVERLPNGLFEYVYSFDAPTANRAEVKRFEIDLSCDEAVPPEDFIGGSPMDTGYTYYTNDRVPYVPALLHQGEDKSRLVDTTRDGFGYLWLIAEPGEQRSLHIQTYGAPILRRYVLKPRVEYYDLLDWDAHPEINGEELPYTPDFEVHGLIEGPGCSDDATQAGQRLGGVNVRQEFESVNDLLTYVAPLRNRLHLEKGETHVAMTVHYSELLDPATFETCPAELRRHFNPVPGARETVRLPIDAARSFVTLAARAKGEQPLQPQHNYASHSPIDVDLFEFRRTDLPYEPRDLACRLYENVPHDLARFPAAPPPEYDGRPLLRFGYVPKGPITAVRGQQYPISFTLSEQADPASVKITVDGENVTGAADIRVPFASFMLPAKLGERHIVIEARAKPEVVGAPKQPARIEHRVQMKGMEVQLRAQAIEVAPDGSRTTREVPVQRIEIDPATGEAVKGKTGEQ